jgi:hypothetical protein
MQAIEYVLKLMTWQWFGSPTWDDAHLGSCRSRVSDLDEFLREEAAREHVCLSDMPLAIRWERGPLTGRPHCHFLWSGFPNSQRITRTQGYRMRARWVERFGLAEFRPWELSLRDRVASYMGKGEPERQDTSGNEHELCKFDAADRLVFNDALWAKLQRITGTSFDVAPTT